MKRLFFKINSFAKGTLLMLRPHILLGWAARPLQLFSNTIYLSKWIAQQDKQPLINDFYSPTKDYDRRYQLYEKVVAHYKLENSPITYMEFGVWRGDSFFWWMGKNTNQESSFAGFDTFEGLPEDWGVYKKGDMSAVMPTTEDVRARFVKGLFQDTLPQYIKEQLEDSTHRKIIHFDADLFSSTLYALTMLAPYLKKGDILLFDEFNVPNHEFNAFKIFVDSYYIKTKLIGAVNNFYQTAVILESDAVK